MDEQEQVIDLEILLKTLKEHIWMIFVAMIACGAIGFVVSEYFVEKLYTSEALLYVENSADKSSSTSLNLNDINAAQKIVDTCQTIFTSDYMLQQLKEQLPRLDYSTADYKDMIAVSSVNKTEVLKISVKTNSPKTSKVIADKMVKLAQNEFKRVIKSGSIEVVSSATLPQSHSFPNTGKFTALGLIIGLIGSSFIFVVISILDKKVKPEDDLAKIYDIPVFAEIVDFTSVNKSDYNYSNYSYGGKFSSNNGEKSK